MDLKELARMIHRCAQALAAEEKRRVDAGQEMWKGICGEWSATGRGICQREAGDELGEVVYYLLGGAWNDVLDWADRILGINEHQPKGG